MVEPITVVLSVLCGGLGGSVLTQFIAHRKATQAAEKEAKHKKVLRQHAKDQEVKGAKAFMAWLSEGKAGPMAKQPQARARISYGIAIRALNEAGEVEDLIRASDLEAHLETHPLMLEMRDADAIDRKEKELEQFLANAKTRYRALEAGVPGHLVSDRHISMATLSTNIWKAMQDLGYEGILPNSVKEWEDRMKLDLQLAQEENKKLTRMAGLDRQPDEARQFGEEERKTLGEE